MSLQMSALCVRFPGLRGRPGTAPWDALKVLRYLCEGGGSHGEKLAARFVLGVWNTTDWVQVAKDEGVENPAQAERFDIFEAWAVWDDAHREAAMSWLRKPFWP